MCYNALNAKVKSPVRKIKEAYLNDLCFQT